MCVWRKCKCGREGKQNWMWTPARKEMVVASRGCSIWWHISTLCDWWIHCTYTSKIIQSFASRDRNVITEKWQEGTRIRENADRSEDNREEHRDDGGQVRRKGKQSSWRQWGWLAELSSSGAVAVDGRSIWWVRCETAGGWRTGCSDEEMPSHSNADTLSIILLRSCFQSSKWFPHWR